MLQKILIVEDDEDILDLLKSSLTAKGYEVEATISCQEGTRIFYSFKPHIVVLDVNVGNEDGREMCRQIKSAADHQHIPVIMMSANDEALQGYQDYQANDILKKPFTLKELQVLLEQHLLI